MVGPRITIDSVKHHGNGSAESFVAILFRWRDGKLVRRCMATLFTQDEGPTEQYAVVDLDDPFERINGPYFITKLDAAAKAASYPEMHARSAEEMTRMKRAEPKRKRDEAAILAGLPVARARKPKAPQRLASSSDASS